MEDSEIGSGAPEKARDFVSARELLRSDKNPTLTRKERLAVDMLVRGVGIKPSEELGEVEIQGLPTETIGLLHDFVTNDEGEKRSFSSTVNNLKPHKAHDLLDAIGLANIRPGRTAKAVFAGDLAGVIERAGKGKGNCFEYALTLNLIAKAYYPESVKEVELLGYSTSTENLGQKLLLKAVGVRNFYLYSRVKDNGDTFDHMTRYEGNHKRISLEEATSQIIEEPKNRRSRDSNDIFENYIKLINLADRRSVQS